MFKQIRESGAISCCFVPCTACNTVYILVNWSVSVRGLSLFMQFSVSTQFQHKTAGPFLEYISLYLYKYTYQACYERERERERDQQQHFQFIEMHSSLTVSVPFFPERETFPFDVLASLTVTP